LVLSDANFVIFCRYNHLSLGLFLFSFTCFVSNFLKLGSVFFVLAVHYKQIELYHALPVAVYLLSRTYTELFPSSAIKSYCAWLRQLLVLFTCVSCTMFVLWFPFIYTRSDLFQILRRIFPFYRGLFEDKVANLWCSLNVLIKLKKNFEILFLLRISAVAVLVTNIPCLLSLYYRPTVLNFKYSLLASSLSFFLFSFQVHEKSILFVALPSLLLWQENPVLVSWLLIISNVRSVNRLAVHGSCLASLLLCLASLVVRPPARYPHIFSLLTAVYCFFHFMLFFLYVNFHMLRLTFKSVRKTV
uniref:Alpha-1,3-glucosyltransferase n=1 Tax=Gongylonema pulchrum TaxID=637853 RepID=A0A183DVB8_9BILA